MNKIKFLHIASAFLIVFLFSQCYYDQILDPVEPDSDTEVSFQADIVPIFNASCNLAGCHNTGGTAPDLTADKAYDALINGNYVDTDSPEDSELYQWMKGNRALPMPVSGSNSAYNSKVLNWIKQGALNN